MGAAGTRLAAAVAVAMGAAWLAGRSPVAEVASGLDSKEDIQKGLNDFNLVGNWIYDDIQAGFARAARESKPLCVVFR
jgi:hypothetical protein